VLAAKQEQRSNCYSKNLRLTHAYLPVENSIIALAESFRLEKWKKRHVYNEAIREFRLVTA
jgi:hypothetical protein